jgi:hypothetical protein
MRDLCLSRICLSSGLVHEIHKIILVRFEGARRQANDPPSSSRPCPQGLALDLNTANPFLVEALLGGKLLDPRDL